MSTKRIVSRKPVRKRSGRRGKTGSAAKSSAAGLSRRLQHLREQIDIVLPEVTARVAALEHLLIEKRLCTKADLIDARAFVRVQEA